MIAWGKAIRATVTHTVKEGHSFLLGWSESAQIRAGQNGLQTY